MSRLVPSVRRALTEAEERRARIQAEAALRQSEERQRALLDINNASLPGFDGIEALATAREHCPEVPFVFVSGAIGEELAIETLKQGATDYVLKASQGRWS